MKRFFKNGYLGCHFKKGTSLIFLTPEFFLTSLTFYVYICFSFHLSAFYDRKINTTMLLFCCCFFNSDSVCVIVSAFVFVQYKQIMMLFISLFIYSITCVSKPLNILLNKPLSDVDITVVK